VTPLRPPDKTGAVFLDRDGVINEIIFHQELGVLESPFTPAQFHLKTGVAEAIRRIHRLGLKAVVVSNQPGIAMRHLTKRALEAITQKMQEGLRRRKARLDGIYYCPHHPLKGKGKLRRRCACRKPKPGLLFQAARDLDIDLRRSYLIGDSITDIEAGLRAGCLTFLLAHLKCDLCNLMAQRNIRPHYLVKNLANALKKIRLLEGVRYRRS